MTQSVLSASGARRWLACALSARLPEEASSPGPAAITGTRFHKALEGAITAQQWVDLDPLDEHMAPALRATLEWVTPQLSDAEVLVEQAYELKPLGHYEQIPQKREPQWRETMGCSRIALTGHREYPMRYGCIYGTADLVILSKGSAHVIDWKTGKKSDDHEAQLLTLALMVAEAEKVSHVRASAVYVNLTNAKITERSWLFDAFDLHLHAGAIVSSAMKILVDKAMPDANPGPHCHFCPAIGCPEKLRTSR